jgi:hypothetical protein
MPDEYSVALTGDLDLRLRDHLIREDGQEDLAFALWTPSRGARRLTALIHTSMLPGSDDRIVHGNVAFNPVYLERVCRAAMREGCGVAFLHSHPFPGWQQMSADDIAAEQRLAGAAVALTDLPLVGMTVGSDGTWSARFWRHVGGRTYDGQWCDSVRVVGDQLKIDFCERLRPRPVRRELFRRTVDVWGEEAYAQLARLTVGIVGLGSVGSLVAGALARMGMTRLVLIDHDIVRPHNLDRMSIATKDDIGVSKVECARDRILKVATAKDLLVRTVPHSVVEARGYRAALDCDVLFSCVDRPRPRSVVDHMAYGHLVPVVDGGIEVRFRRREFSGVDWQLQTVGPGRRCLECHGVYDPGDVSTEAAGKLDDPSYLKGLPADHHLKRNENVFPFSMNLASLETLQLVALVTGAAGMESFGVQRYRYTPGIVDVRAAGVCEPECDRADLLAQGDRHFSLIGRDIGAERVRRELDEHAGAESSVEASEVAAPIPE